MLQELYQRRNGAANLSPERTGLSVRIAGEVEPAAGIPPGVGEPGPLRRSARGRWAAQCLNRKGLCQVLQDGENKMTLYAHFRTPRQTCYAIEKVSEAEFGEL